MIGEIKILKFENGEPYSIGLPGNNRLFGFFIDQITTNSYYEEIKGKVESVLTGNINEYTFEHNDVYLSIKKDLTSIRVEHIEDQYAEGQAPREEYFSEIETNEFLEVLNIWWKSYSEYLETQK